MQSLHTYHITSHVHPLRQTNYSSQIYSTCCLRRNGSGLEMALYCSFYADEVKIQHSRSAITCGETALLCSMELTNPNSKFKDYHENKITIFNRDKNAVAVEDL